jgi:uncharacterized RDD family membrane protein YckC
VSADVFRAESQQGHFAGPVTRLAAFALDQATATGVFALASAVVSWTIQLVTESQVELDNTAIIGALAYALWWFLYFAYPWGTSGKTFGMAVLGIRVVARDGSVTTPKQAVARTLGLVLSFLTLGLGFVGIVIGREHRSLHDALARTVVVYDWDARGARLRFLARQQRHAAPNHAAPNHAALHQAAVDQGALGQGALGKAAPNHGSPDRSG